MDYKDLANLIFPDAKEISYYEEKYPERDLTRRSNSNKICTKSNRIYAYRWFIQALIAIKVAKQTNGVFFLRVEDTDQKEKLKME